ncbi:MAG: HAMP domain-containing histidine kinase [Nitrospirae bacterium]|nr:HAMP domain-containing histidine kinase [Nitrospirota bacterium]
MLKKIRYRPSIRQKITFGYYAIVPIIIALSVFSFVELRFFEKKLLFGKTIAEFFNTTLEVRRFEKNFFLYKQESDYRESISYASEAQKSLEDNMAEFNTLVSPMQTAMLVRNLKEYKQLMRQYANPEIGTSLSKEVLDGMIRKTGKEIVNAAEDIARTERKRLQVQLYNSQILLLISIISLSLLGIVVGHVLSRMVIRPLKRLEESMEIIADGRFEIIHIDSKDREIVSLTNAFNKMLKELELRQRHLIQTEKLASLGTLLSGVAHELNNPLSNISSSCQILAEEITENDMEYKKELLSQIDEQTDRARNIVRSLLEFSRDKDFKKETLPLKNLIEETIRFIKGQVPTKVEIEVSVPDDIVIFADKQRIQQVFLNLIKNAIEAISGEGIVYVRALRRSAIEKAEEEEPEIYNYLKYHGKCTVEEDTVDIEISDTGSGIDADILTKVFDPFFTTKDVGKGSGLGLSIVHEIILEHDGCIAVDSRVGSGTTFLIRLPIPRGTGKR